MSTATLPPELLSPAEQQALWDQAQRDDQRQLLREAWADDVRQKLAINRALYAAGYGLDPRPYGTPYERPKSPEPAAAAATLAQSPQAGSLRHWGKAIATGLLLVASGGGAAGLTAAILASLNDVVPAVAPNAAAPPTEPLQGRIRFWVDDQGQTTIEDQPLPTPGPAQQ